MGLDRFGDEFTVCAQKPHFSNHKCMDRSEEAGVKFKCWRQRHLEAKTDVKLHQPESAGAMPPCSPRMHLGNQSGPDLEGTSDFVCSNLLLQVGRLRPEEELTRVSGSWEQSQSLEPKPRPVLFCHKHVTVHPE